MVHIQIISDLHIEQLIDDFIDPLNFFTPNADLLIMAGDIGSIYRYNQLYHFLEKVANMFTYVLYVPGNWEYYMLPNYTPLTINELNNRLNSLSVIKNLYILNTSSIIIDNVCFVGCTLWSDLKISLPHYIVKIFKMNTSFYSYKHSKDKNFITDMTNYCKENNIKMVVITHHCPSYETLQKWKKKDKFTSLYASNLDYMLDKNLIDTWICGHVHINFDFYSEKGTRVISNQRGKPKDKITDYNKNLTIQV